MTPQYFQSLARYNTWANGRIYDAAAKLPDGEYYAPRKAFFGSIHNTLNHILVGDRIWLGRFEGVPHGIASLDQVLYDDFASLRAARVEEDARTRRMMDGLTEARLAGTVHYANMDGSTYDHPLGLLIGHFFNHQTHHRGQLHDMLTQTEVPPPPLDLLVLIREGDIR